MGLIDGVFGLLFGGGRNALKETVEVFRENAQEGAQLSASIQTKAMELHAKEFDRSGKGAFDKFMDGLNRMPRPLLALGTLALFVSAMISPLWFAERMQGIALVPEPLWWLLGVIVSFYFGARHQVKTQQFQREIAATVARAPQIMENIQNLRAMRSGDKGAAETRGDADLTLAAIKPEANAALSDWKTRTV